MFSGIQLISEKNNIVDSVAKVTDAKVHKKIG